MIEVRDLNLSLGDKLILQDVNFRLEDGDNLIILGRSGSGKTVLIKTLMGFYPPDSGSVTIDGTRVYVKGSRGQDSPLQQFAMVFQGAALLDSYTVFQNVALPLYERGEQDQVSILSRVRECLAIVGLEDTLYKYPAELSGGMRKRVGIARALVYKPSYIIFDEPVSGLDPITANEVLFYITQIISTAAATTITITHDIRNLTNLGDRILFLEEGRSLFFGSVKDFEHSEQEMLKRYQEAVS